MSRSAERAKGGVSRWNAARGLPDIYIAMGQAAEKIRLVERVSRVDTDVVEINEDFAAQVIHSALHLEVPWEKLNVNGGAIALGHPYGMTGSRIMTTLLNGLQTTDKTIGLDTMCVAGGQGMAMIIERLS